MVKVIPTGSAWKTSFKGVKDGAIGGLATGLGRAFAGVLGSIVGGVIAGAMTSNEMVSLNATMDGVASLFL